MEARDFLIRLIDTPGYLDQGEGFLSRRIVSGAFAIPPMADDPFYQLHLTLKGGDDEKSPQSERSCTAGNIVNIEVGHSRCNHFSSSVIHRMMNQSYIKVRGHRLNELGYGKGKEARFVFG